MKHLQTLALALCLTFAATAFGKHVQQTTLANTNYRNATFNLGSNGQYTANYTIGNVQIGMKQTSPVIDPFAIQHQDGNVNPDSILSGNPISDPFIPGFGEVNSTNMSDLLTYMSTQSFKVQNTGMLIQYNAEESVNDMGFGNSAFCGMTSATVEVVNVTTGQVVTAYTMPSLCTLNWWSHQASSPATMEYDIPDSWVGNQIYIRMNIQETVLPIVPYTSVATVSTVEGDQGFSPYDNSTRSNASWKWSSMFGKDITPTNDASVSLAQNFPNPVTGTTTITVNNVNGPATLQVFDVTGRMIFDLTNQLTGTGTQNVTFDASNLHAGSYFYRLSTAGSVITKMLNVVK